MELGPPSQKIARNSLIDWAHRREAHSRCLCSPLLFHAYHFRVFRPIVRALLNRLEGGRMFSQTLRDILERQYGVTVGMYSYGGALRPGHLPRGVSVGNYSSIADRLHVHRRNHPIERISQHPLFFNSGCGLLNVDNIDGGAENPLAIGHDVWIGSDVIILPHCSRIGDGAVVGAGSVVTHDVEPFTVVAGNPARFVRRRFSQEIEDLVVESEWWLRPIPDLIDCLPDFMDPASVDSVSRIKAHRK